MHHNIAPIVLAAGASRRFGGDKLLHPVGEDAMPLAARSLVPWLEIFLHVTVVVRDDSETLQERIAQALGPARAARIDWQRSPDADDGMSASLAAGVGAHLKAAGWLIGLADMPSVPARVIAEVRDAIAGGALLAAPFCHGRRGHPAGFSSHYLEDLMALQGDAGARDILSRNAEWVHPVRTEDPGIFIDIDTPRDVSEKL